MMSPPLKPPHATRPASSACYIRYHSDSAVAQYCNAHYGPDKFGVPNFSARLVHLCRDALGEQPRRRALDLGCAVGRASFELATCFDHVDGIDYSSRFIEIACRLQARGRITYQVAEEGELLRDRRVSLADLGLQETAARVVFARGNALSLDAGLRDYDLVLAANLIDRLSDPATFLAHIHRRLVPGGLLAIASPYCWKAEFTPKKHWLGGRCRRGLPLDTRTELSHRLAAHFEAAAPPQEVEFVLRETARTFQHSIAQLTLWRRAR